MLDLDPTTIGISIFFGLIGMGYYSYGKKSNVYFRLTGVGLMLYPYLLNSVALLLGVGVLLTILPFILTQMSPLD